MPTLDCIKHEEQPEHKDVDARVYNALLRERNELLLKLNMSLNMHLRHSEHAWVGIRASGGHVCPARIALEAIGQRADRTMKDYKP